MRPKIKIAFGAIFGISITLVCLHVTGFSLNAFRDFAHAYHFLSRWFPINTEIFWPMVGECGITLAIAFLGSFGGLLLALPLSFLAASRTSGGTKITTTTRTSTNILRAMPEIVIALVFLTILGPGPFPAVLALMLHNIGAMTKIISERIEEEPPGPYEAMIALGARPNVASCFGMLPQIGPTVISQYFYRFEVAIRTSLVLGFVGGGGIGQQLFNHFNTFQYPSVATDVLIITLLVIVVDVASLKVQKSVS